jgi:hypothetical protein
VTDDRELWDMAIMHNLSLARARAAEVRPSILTLSRRRLTLTLQHNEPIINHMAPFANINEQDIDDQGRVRFLRDHPGHRHDEPERLVGWLVSVGTEEGRAREMVHEKLRREAREERRAKRHEEVRAREMERAASGPPLLDRFLRWDFAGGNGVLGVGFVVGSALWLMVDWNRVFGR